MQLRLRTWLVAVLGVAVLSACGGTSATGPDASPTGGTGVSPEASPSAQPADPGLILGADFGDKLGLVLGEGAVISFQGQAANEVDTTVMALGGARLKTVTGSNNHGVGVQFPGKGEGVAAIAAIPRGVDVLSPGKKRFSFGADFKASGDWGEGSNLVQRGLFTDKSQYKLELDGGRPSCSIKGSEGEVVVHSSQSVHAGLWYSVQCARYDEAVVLTLRRLRDSEEWVSLRNGRTGEVRADTASVPFSVGAKLWPDPGLGKDPDQFRGVVDNVYLRYEQ